MVFLQYKNEVVRLENKQSFKIKNKLYVTGYKDDYIFRKKGRILSCITVVVYKVAKWYTLSGEKKSGKSD